MKNILIVLTFAMIFSNCDEGEDFVCNENTISVVNNEKKCGQSIITGYSNTAGSESFVMKIAGGYTISMYSNNGLFQEGVVYEPSNFTFVNVNQIFSNTITFEKIDRINKSVTLKFSFHNEAESNYQAYELKAEGEIRDMTFN